MNKFKTVFLDRDGVINKERSDYIKSISELEIFPNVAKNIELLKNAGFLVVVITNQSVINRGLITHETVDQIHDSIQNYLKSNGTSIDGFFYCRKPKPGLLHQAILELDIDPKSSWMIGDNNSDIEAATSIGCQAIKISKDFSLGKAVRKILDSGTD